MRLNLSDFTQKFDDCSTPGGGLPYETDGDARRKF